MFQPDLKYSKSKGLIGFKVKQSLQSRDTLIQSQASEH